MIRSTRIVLFGGCLIAAQTATVPAQLPMEIVEAVATLDSGGDEIDSLVGLIQSGSADDIREQRALDLSEFVSRVFSSVFINEAQSNPLQPDVRYRGFVASPLLGLPQGIAVYQDGVRVNEPFGDTVNWALLPRMAIDSVYLVPGSNPLFGLNSLGGALSVRTKSGASHPGARLSALFGSHSRSEISAETGGLLRDRTGYYFAGTYLEEDGWRDFSPSRSSSIFGKLSHETAVGSVDLSFTSVETNLIGNGAAPIQLLSERSTAIFTRPDQTRNDLDQIALELSRNFASGISFSGSAYFRRSDIETLNGDDSDFEECEQDPVFVCLEEDDDGREEEYEGADPELDMAGEPIEALPHLLGATVNRTNTLQDARGFSLQLTRPDSGQRNLGRWLLGITLDDSDVDFSGSTELGMLDPTRLAIPGGAIVADSLTSLHAESRNVGLYLAYTAAPTDALSVSVSGRFNRTNITLYDRLGTALNGDHEFSKFNPALGVTWRFAGDLTVSASLSQSNRAPSPVELTCADEDDPCRLPNAFLSDPPLDQVIARTVEVGLRSDWSNGTWSASLFHTETRDEILFISAGALTNQGFFDNVGRTRRQGIEGSLEGEISEDISWFLGYSWLEATFRSAFNVPSPNHPESIDGEFAVSAGDRLPLVPDRQLKVGFRFSPTPAFRLSGDFQINSGSHLRGDEANATDELDSFAIMNLRASYSVNDRLSVFLKVDNVLDESYETFGIFGEADEVLGDKFDNPRFVSPGAPRAGWLGVDLEF